MTAASNPFRTSRLEERLFFRPEWSGLTWEGLEKGWEANGRKGAITGPHGAGKTTLLEAWQERLEEKGERVVRVFLNQQDRVVADEVLREIADATVLLVDGAEQLIWWRRRKLITLAEGKDWLETRHRKAGLPVIVELQPSREILNHCLAELDESIPAEDLNQWWESHHGNLREIFLRSYDWKAQKNPE